MRKIYIILAIEDDCNTNISHTINTSLLNDREVSTTPTRVQDNETMNSSRQIAQLHVVRIVTKRLGRTTGL